MKGFAAGFLKRAEELSETHPGPAEEAALMLALSEPDEHEGARTLAVPYLQVGPYKGMKTKAKKRTQLEAYLAKPRKLIGVQRAKAALGIADPVAMFHKKERKALRPFRQLRRQQRAVKKSLIQSVRSTAKQSYKR